MSSSRSASWSVRGGDRRSRAALGGHPIHPLIIPVPAVTLAGTLVTDLAYLGSRDKSWARMSRRLLQVGLVSGAIAAPFGLTDFLSIREARRHPAGWLHAFGNLAALGLAGANLSRRQRRPERRIWPEGLALSAATAGVLLMTAWFGGELAYRYGVGVSLLEDEESGPQVERDDSGMADSKPSGRRWSLRRGGRGGEAPGTPVMAPEARGATSPDLVALREPRREGGA